MTFLVRDWIVIFAAILLCAVTSFILPLGDFYVVLSMVLMLVIFVLFLSFLYRLEDSFPLFDLGLMLVGITFLYCFYPLLSYAASGFEWGMLSDNRLRTTRMSSEQMAMFSIHHIVYLISLSLAYATFRSRRKINQITVPLETEPGEAKLVLIFIVFIEIFGFVIAQYGEERSALPHVIWQVHNGLAQIKFIFTLYIAAFAFAHWKIKWLRFLIIVYVLYEIAMLLTGRAGRTWLFLHLLGYAMLFHRLVRPITFKGAILLFVTALFVFVMGGFFRHGSYLQEITSLLRFFQGSNEFSSLFGTAWDLYHRKEILGTLTIPWQVFWDDLLYLIPSQFLPWEKLSLSQWYLEIIDQRGRGVGFMFGVISQGVVGGSYLELAVRGAVTGFVFAKIHDWYLNRTQSFWALVAYVFLAVKSYYIFRASTSYIVYFVIYHLLPAYLIIQILVYVLIRQRKIANNSTSPIGN